MKKMIAKATLSTLISAAIISAFAGGVEAPVMLPGLYLGIGGSWNVLKIEERATTTMQVGGANPIRVTGYENFTEQNNFLAPAFQLGYWNMLPHTRWLLGAHVQYKYLNFQTQAEDIYSAGSTPGVFNRTDFRNRVTNELLALAYFGYAFSRSYAYLGIGASEFWVNSAIIFSSQNIGTANNQIRQDNSFSVNRAIPGYAVELGYNFYMTPTWFWSMSYIYAESATRNFDNDLYFNDIISNQAINDPVNSTRRLKVSIQEFMFSLNKVFYS